MESKPKPDLHKFILYGIIFLLVLYCFHVQKKEKIEPDPLAERVPDTVYVDRVQTKYIEVKAAVNPGKVQIYKADTTRRKHLESGTITQGIEAGRKKIEIHSIDSAGVSYISTYPTSDLVNVPFAIDATGRLQIDPKDLRRYQRRKRWRRIGNTAIAVGAFVAGVWIGSK